MDELAEHIIKKARTVPVKTSISFDLHGVSLTKVAVVGGFGLEVTLKNGNTLLYPYSQAQYAIECFIQSGLEADERSHKCTRSSCVFHGGSGHVFANFTEIQSTDAKHVRKLLLHTLKAPPLFNQDAEAPNASSSIDVREMIGWMPEDAPEVGVEKEDDTEDGAY